jgi:hypothetical protein
MVTVSYLVSIRWLAAEVPTETEPSLFRRHAAGVWLNQAIFRLRWLGKASVRSVKV